MQFGRATDRAKIAHNSVSLLMKNTYVKFEPKQNGEEDVACRVNYHRASPPLPIAQKCINRDIPVRHFNAFVTVSRIESALLNGTQ